MDLPEGDEIPENITMTEKATENVEKSILGFILLILLVPTIVLLLFINSMHSKNAGDATIKRPFQAMGAVDQNSKW